MPANRNRRKFFRIKLDTPLCGILSVAQINNTSVKTGTSNVCINDIGPGGLRFLSNLSLPASPAFVVKVQIVMISQIFELQGFLVRRSLKAQNTYEYGMQFVFAEEAYRAKMVSILNILTSRLSRGVKVESCRFCAKDRPECWKAPAPI